MGKKKHDDKPGYGKLLEAWVAPDDSGDPIGCVATNFTFSPVFFEEECLARFLQLESDPNEDGPVYLVEREEKLAQVACASALVDQHHCRGSRSLRWDLLAARLPGLQHAKVSLLVWSKLVRIVIGSANLTDDGYRRNQEVFGVLDYRAGGDSPISCLTDTVAFLRKAGLSSSPSADENQSPALSRWNALLDKAIVQAGTWGLTDDEIRRSTVRVHVVFSGPGYANVFGSLKSLWPGGSPPDLGSALSPFFDRPEAPNAPAQELWRLLRQRGDATVEFHVAAEEIPGEDSIFIYAPKSLLDAQPVGRASVTTDFYRVVLSSGRSLHAKGLWLENKRWCVYQIGSSNFTSAGTGLAKESNLEANLVYIVDSRRDAKATKLLEATFPESKYLDLESGVKWKPLSGEGKDAVGEEVVLPAEFGNATYHSDAKQRATIAFQFAGIPPDDWELITDGDDRRFFGQDQWIALEKPPSCELPWDADRPPSGFWVRWKGSGGSAWWPVNVTAGDVLPPPEELRNLPLEVLINILSSARPLHRVLAKYLRRRKSDKPNGDDAPVVDPHKRVDTSQFLLQRTRRISWALNGLRKRLERPVVTLEFLRWRLHGPVGVLALAKALVREAKSTDEKTFLLSELALELARVKPESAPGCVSPDEHKAEIHAVIDELRVLIPEREQGEPENLRQYIDSVFAAVSS